MNVFFHFCFAKILHINKEEQRLTDIDITMFQRLQQKWKVNGLQVLLILCTFAIGGSLTGFAGKKLMNLLSIEQDGCG